jgi:hypothetical protein
MIHRKGIAVHLTPAAPAPCPASIRAVATASRVVSDPGAAASRRLHQRDGTGGNRHGCVRFTTGTTILVLPLARLCAATS